MSTGAAPALSEGIVSTRSVARYKLTVPLALTVLRSGIPNQIPGRTFEIGEGGMGVVPSVQLLVGESVRVEFLVPHMSSPVRATAVVRYQREGGCFGLQFLRLPVEQQSIVRYWTRREGELLLAAQAGAGFEEEIAEPNLLSASDSASEVFEDSESLEGSAILTPRPRIRHIVVVAALITVIAATLGWWHWQREWAKLEAQVPAQQSVIRQSKLNVPADVMARRIVYHVMPQYPEPARQAGVQGTVVLDTVVSAQGTVTQMKVVSGVEVLSKAAMDAVRWWRYEPYLVSGQPVTVETTVAVNFRLAN
jgi:TonB family protein